MKALITTLLLFISQTVYADCIILIHGMGRSALSMLPIKYALSEENHTVINTQYSVWGKTISGLSIEVIPQAINDCPEDQPISFVTHSLGGIIVRHYLSEHHLPRLNSIVMIAPPNHGSEIVDFLKHSFLYPYIKDEVIAELSTDNTLPYIKDNQAVSIGIIAGGKSMNWISSKIIPGIDDGKVSIESTLLDTMDDHIILDNTHTFITMSPTALDQISVFLKNGKFNHP